MNGTYENFRSEKYFSSLDGLRCISVVAVIWHHTASKYFSDITLLTTGHLGVELFFAISGFLITTLLLREKESKGEISLKKFYIRRTLRIFPLYYTIILVYVVLVTIVEGSSPYGVQFFKNVKYYFTYSSNWFVERNDIRVIFYIAWSLATEEQFYLMWPSVERFLKGKWPVVVMISAVLFVQMVDFGLTDSLIAPASFLHKVIVNIAPPICMGVLLAHLLHGRKGFNVARSIVGYQWSSLAALGLLVIIISFAAPPRFLVQFMMVVVVASTVVRDDHWLKGIFVSAPFKRVGMVSYGMYLMHMLSFHVVQRGFNLINVTEPITKFVATVFVTFGAASLSYKYYEGFFLRLKDRFAA